MLGGVKFIPRDQLNTNEGSDSSIKQRKKLGSKKEKSRSRKKSSQNYSSDDEEPEKIKKGSRRNKKWYSSDEHSFSSWSESESGSDLNENNRQRSRKAKKPSDGSSMDKSRHKVKKRLQRNRKHHSSESYSSFASESDGSDNTVGSKDDHRGRRKQESTKFKQKGVRQATAGEVLSDDDRGRLPQDDKEFVRKEMGLEWMVKPMDKSERSSQTDDPPQEPQVEVVRKPNPREMNPYLRDDGSGYPEDADQPKVSGGQLLSSSVVGDGGASWRMKALKRSQEQAAREGRKLDEVVEERWGSLGQLAVSVASRAAAPTHAHLRAIRERKRRVIEKHETVADDIKEREGKKVYGDNREYLRDVSVQNPRMREPRVHDSLSWRKRNVQKPSREEDTRLIYDAASSLNKFSNDGSFMNEVTSHCNRDAHGSIGSSNTSSVGKEPMETEMVSLGTDNTKAAPVMQILSANQLAAKALQLRMKGKHEEADKLLKEAENSKAEQEKETKLSKLRMEGSVSRYVKHDISIRHKKKEEDADMHLAQKIVQNKKYSIASQADQEYDYEDIPSRKRHQRSGELPKHKETQNNIMAKRILTQQERCHFCFENPTRPKHLVVSIANFTYMMLPQSQSIVSGHCCILPMQHESATRSVDNNVWEEIRNFKKCLITMFSKQEKDVIFLETVMGLAQQRRHCLVECIPLPREIAKEAPLYFKKAIDEAEDEWSQHNAKKLIDTSEKGLRGSIPKDFPYFHVEFGLKRGFVHVIDDEKQFTSSLGLNVIRGMLRLPEEDMYRRRKHESVETQKQAVASFVKEWQHFDWTKQLD